ncbi:zinc finger BED domain-containing protein RICESLEEPER 2-like [Dioscorea cayenensis subsp. rotundata]|uniref:Zinc finger BED domain-containing protein RICESLEEPER 2-like n=1 Tax=Dioscorea cayennensis subsp. rotundata TaxID=55577 RepID=A0AB40AUZ7_DIOCR|nr:zinc finger BED domain-containing protein RICESLEEPER 2-like [Dioscorea cayenensis subsp. rotundata]
MLMSSSLKKGNVELRHQKLNQEQHRENIVMAILLHEYPFQFVEHEGTRNMISYLNPDVKHVTRNTIKADVLKFYRREKKKLLDILQLVPGRISLTSDLWASITTDGYISLTAHFVDKDWMLQKRILNFHYMPTPHTGFAISEMISSLLNEWNLEKKLFSITLDNASSNDSFVDFVKSQLCIRNGLLLNGEFFHVRCCAHILNLIVQDGLKEIDSGIYKIRESVKFMKGSQSRKKKFHDCAQQMGINCKKGLRQDVSTRWNSTYLMLESALHYRDAFIHLSLSDSNYLHCPTLEEWNQIENMVKFLKVFYDVTNIFSGTLYPTSNLFFLGMWRIQCILQEEAKNPILFRSSSLSKMQSKFDKYWGAFSAILAIAVILDPRYKMDIVEFAFMKLYGDDEGNSKVNNIREKLQKLFGEYCNIDLQNQGSSYTIQTTQDQVIEGDPNDPLMVSTYES